MSLAEVREMSKTYVAVQRSGQKQNELTHWKYIKREKKNGKWRYYYDRDSLKADVKDKLGYDEKERFEKANEAYEKAGKDMQSKYDKAARYNHTIVTNAEKNGQYDDRYRVILSEHDIEYRDKLYKSADDAMKRVDHYGEIASKAAIAYIKTPLYKIEKVKKVLDKGSDWLKKKLGIH